MGTDPEARSTPVAPLKVLYWVTATACFGLLAAAQLKPDTSIMTWAREEAARRDREAA